ncbi:unnamed protein product, partial [Prorocentrum cordatum]
MAGVHKLWSGCSQCQTCEWNAALLRRQLACSKCGNTVEFYRGRKRGVRFASAESDDEQFHDATGDSEGEGVQLRKPVPPGILKKGATAGGKGGKGSRPTAEPAGHGATQSTRTRRAVANVARPRGNLAAAEAKEQAKKAAATALARAEGAQDCGASAPGERERKMSNVEWDEGFFSNLDELGATEGEKEALEELKGQMQQAKSHLEGKEAEIQAWLAKMAEHKKTISERLAKKRKSTEGSEQPQATEAPGEATGPAAGSGPPPTAAAPGPAPPGSSGAPGTKAEADGAREVALKAEAKRLSEAKFKAAELRTKAAGKGSAAT